MRSVLAVVVVIAVAGCGYRAGSYHWPRAAFAGARVTVDCTDIAISRRADDDSGYVTVQYELGNRCDAPEAIDFANVHVVGTTADGREEKLVPFDPDNELAKLSLDGRSYATEAIAYRDEGSDAVVSACVDAASITHSGPPRWVCTREPHGPVNVAVAAAWAARAGSDDDESDCSNPGGVDYVGDRSCGTRFGTWALPMRLPPMFLDWGFQLRSVDVTLPSGSKALAPAFTTNFRFGIGITHGVYVGLDTEVGGAWGAAESASAPGLPPPTAAIYVGMYGVTGVRGSLGPVSLATEIGWGFRAVQEGATQTAGSTQQMGLSDFAGAIEARVRAELWLSPWVSAGITAGVNALDTSEQMGGVFFSLHSRAYGGDRAH